MSGPIEHDFSQYDDIFSFVEKQPPSYVEDVRGARLIEVAEFKRLAADGGITDEQGYGYPVRNGKSAKGRNIGLHGEHVVKPSCCADIPNNATHIAWYE